MVRSTSKTGPGLIAPEEREIVERVFRFGERPITAVVTPRVDLEWLDIRKRLAELRVRSSRQVVTAGSSGG